ncbi:hypothetical protein [Mycobacterium kyorinense]|uniref:Uncharacterized protein n=1 Tax=Mycobacterium kyorinense TaxID=487514 RepID=A0A1X1YHK2_9MYCO|nr:hypothetical protein [Mycobacterium kyorinense]ORW10592.1 hypothetical protein AWC14_20060 [Mycobacterium kyorinense]
MSTYLDTPQAQQGRSDSDDSAAAAEHSADIADMVAIRAESHAGRAGGWARDAQHYAVLAEIRSSTAQLGGGRATAAAREVWHTVAIAMLALGLVFGIALSVAVDDAVVRIVHNTVGITQERIVHDTRAVQPDSLMPSEGPRDKDAVPGGSATTSPGPTTSR